MDTLESHVLLEGIVFGEGPRWRDGKLWFSDIWGRQVMTVDLDGRPEVVVSLPGDDRPSGLGFLPDGTPLVVGMGDRKVWRLGPGAPALAADLSDGSTGLNDMCVDQQGRAYLDCMTETGGSLALLEIDGTVRTVADDLSGPNGIAITADGRTLIVAEFQGNRLTAFDVDPNGSLSGRRTFAEIQDAAPDGICVDAEGAIWAGLPLKREFQRIVEGGQVTHRITCEGKATVAPMLGGPDRRTLFLMTARTTWEGMEVMTNDARIRDRSVGWVETARVDVPGAGWP